MPDLFLIRLYVLDAFVFLTLGAVAVEIICRAVGWKGPVAALIAVMVAFCAQKEDDPVPVQQEQRDSVDQEIDQYLDWWQHGWPPGEQKKFLKRMENDPDIESRWIMRLQQQVREKE